MYSGVPFSLIFTHCKAQVQGKYDTIVKFWASFTTAGISAADETGSVTG